MIPDTHNVFDPEILMREVIRHTHYMPAEWKDNLHSVKVHAEFGQLFAMKAIIFVQEILSVVLTPLVLWFSLPDCAPAITDFFREFTVHVDGLGYVCSFAVFDFKRHGNVNVSISSRIPYLCTDAYRWQKFGAPTEQADKKLQSKDGKMEKSFLAFKAAHPEWNPRDTAGSLYLSRLANLHQNLQPVAASLSQQETLARGAGYGSASTSLPPLHRSTLAERSQFYERALQHSMASASAAGETTAMGGSMQMKTASGRPHAVAELQAESLHEEMVNQEEERAEDGGLISRLGDSFADDVRLRGGRLVLDSQEGTGRKKDAVDEVEAEELSNGGVLGLLAQIYDRRRPPLM
jgi:autophagy-related protein 9